MLSYNDTGGGPMSGFVMAIVQLWLEVPAMIGYIRGQAFQRPLSKEEEADCLRRLAEGDEDAKDELIERNMRLSCSYREKIPS